MRRQSVDLELKIRDERSKIKDPRLKIRSESVVTGRHYADYAAPGCMTFDHTIRLTDRLPVFFDRICCRSWDFDGRKGAGWDLNMKRKDEKEPTN
jgi:hypothetical protein